MSVLGVSADQLLFAPIGLLAFVVLLTIIVFFHEYGHFSVARLLGVRVDVFSIGFGKALARWTDRHGTEWRIAMLPFGGYVKFFGDAGPASDAGEAVADADEPAAEDGDPKDARASTRFPRADEAGAGGRGLTPEEKAVCFHFKPLWRRAAIVAAGPMANFLLAFVIFWGLLIVLGQGYWQARVGSVAPDSAAEAAGILAGDRIVAIDGRKIESFQDLSSVVILSAGDERTFEIERDGRTIEIQATPRRQDSVDGFGNRVRVGILGVRPAEDGYVFRNYGPGEAVPTAAAKVWSVISSTVRFIGRLLFGKEDPSQLGGPVKIAKYAGQSAMSGFDESRYGSDLGTLEKVRISLATFVNLAAVVSVSIGFLNLLPIPVLDGGHLMYYAYEAIAGKPLGARAQALGFRLGLVFLASLMIFVTWNDISAFVERG